MNVNRPSLAAIIPVLMLLLGSCGRCGDVPCLSFRWCCGRPDVMVDWEECVIDYNDCFEPCDLGDCLICKAKMEPLEITPDLFDPYQPIDPDYQLTKGDVLEVAVFDEEETFVDGAIVAPDGKLYYSVAKGVQAAGRAPEEVAKDLSKELDGLFLDPKVTVVPKQIVYPTYRILGRVRRPGDYQITGPITVREAIAEAGGLFSQSERDIGDHPGRISIPYTNLKTSFMVRGDKRVEIDFEKLIYSASIDQNIYVKPGDYIYLSGEDLREIYMLGYAASPQRLPYSEEMTLMNALARAGGWGTFSPYSADMYRIIVIRNALNCPCPDVCVVDINKILRGEARDLKLCPGDIVYASHKQWRTLRDAVDIALDGFISGFLIRWGAYFSGDIWFSTSSNGDDSNG